MWRFSFKMEPLDVMASLVGLLGSAGKVVFVLLAIKNSISNAPKLMYQVLFSHAIFSSWKEDIVRSTMLRLERYKSCLSYVERRAIVSLRKCWCRPQSFASAPANWILKRKNRW